MKRFEHPSANELEALRQAIAASPIRLTVRPAPAAIIPGWESLRRSENVDGFVLAWIASHVSNSYRRTH